MHTTTTPSTSTIAETLAQTIERDLRAAGFTITKQRRPMLSLFRKTR